MSGEDIMGLTTLLPLVVAGGAAGGLAAGLSRVRIESLGFRYDEAFPASGRSWIAALFIPMFVGVAGAIAVQFAIVLIANDTRFHDTSLNQIFLLSISAAAGFGARTLLPLLSATVEKQVASIADRTEAIGRTTQEMSGLVEEIREQTREKQVRDVSENVVNGLIGDRTAVSDNAVQKALNDLEALMARDPGNYQAERTSAVIYALQGNVDEAEKRFAALIAKTPNRPGYTNRIYNAMFNLACVQARKYAAGQTNILPKIISTLRELAAKDPPTAKLILTEEDLAPVRLTAEFKEIETALKKSTGK